MKLDNLRVSTKLWGAFLGLMLMALAGAAVVGCLIIIYLLAAAASALADRSVGKASLNP